MAKDVEKLISKHAENSEQITQKHQQVEEAWDKLHTKASERSKKLQESFKYTLLLWILFQLFLNELSVNR